MGNLILIWGGKMGKNGEIKLLLDFMGRLMREQENGVYCYTRWGAYSRGGEKHYGEVKASIG